jgi:hypothetical protein
MSLIRDREVILVAIILLGIIGFYPIPTTINESYNVTVPYNVTKSILVSHEVEKIVQVPYEEEVELKKNEIRSEIVFEANETFIVQDGEVLEWTVYAHQGDRLHASVSSERVIEFYILNIEQYLFPEDYWDNNLDSAFSTDINLHVDCESTTIYYFVLTSHSSNNNVESCKLERIYDKIIISYETQTLYKNETKTEIEYINGTFIDTEYRTETRFRKIEKGVSLFEKLFRTP